MGVCLAIHQWRFGVLAEAEYRCEIHHVHALSAQFRVERRQRRVGVTESRRQIGGHRLRIKLGFRRHGHDDQRDPVVFELSVEVENGWQRVGVFRLRRTTDLRRVRAPELPGRHHPQFCGHEKPSFHADKRGSIVFFECLDLGRKPGAEFFAGFLGKNCSCAHRTPSESDHPRTPGKTRHAHR